MTDSDERIAKLQKLLDRVLTRGEPEEEQPSEDPNGERTQLSQGEDSDEAAEDEAPAVVEKPADPSGRDLPWEEESPPLESRSRLVTAQQELLEEEEAEELTEDDLVPASESPEAAMPLVRRSKRPSEEPHKAAPPAKDVEATDHASTGRMEVALSEVQIADAERREEEESLAAEAAAEEVHSSELAEQEAEEEAPASSRRPITNESVAEGDDYSSPPESGKQVAVAPFEAPPAQGRKSTSPPSAMREPDVIRAEVPPSGKVASITPALPYRPATFGELLDAALEL